eukprot:8665368-Pyramimonas_sp.AAC.1
MEDSILPYGPVHRRSPERSGIDMPLALRGGGPNPVQDQHTRVMSPNRITVPDPNRAILHGFTMTCQVCRTMAAEPATCSKCGMLGHPQCLGLEFFQDFPFCGECIFGIIKEYSDYSTQ